ncbi:ester cyclase [Hymenobacter setariae]|uniref:Ester cyclase n=1 Tax=Hymenobacter setariae TaxID=2594794 RepID=A0A558BVH4_9BACT|nr:ester cyclase [Hymenobacter setariae]TVT40527.1 ester cyclase [Hymenobacter setariae]
MATPSSLQPLSAAELQAVQLLYQAFSDNNPDLVDQAVTPTWQDIPLGPGQATGPDGIKPIIAQFRRAFPDLTIVIHELIGSAGRAAVRAEIRGTHQGEWFGIAATNRPISLALHEFHHLENGRITHTWHLEDWFGMFHQLGALPPSL